MAQGVDAELFMMLHESAFVLGDFDGHPDTRFGHRIAAVVKGLLHGDARALPTAPRGGKKPVGIAMPFPKVTQPFDHGRGDGNLARLAAFGVIDPQNAAFAIDVFGADMQCFAHAQPAVIDEGEVGAVSAIAESP